VTGRAVFYWVLGVAYTFDATQYTVKRQQRLKLIN